MTGSLRRVIFSADDFGLDHAVNEAVEIAHREGVLDAASLMVAAPGAADAVARAKKLPGLAVGLHLVLVDGAPASPANEISALLDRRGGFAGPQALAGVRFFFDPRARAALAREIEAQFAAFAATGLALDHVDAHKHMHLHPTVAGLILRIGRRHGMRALRVPMEPPAPLAAADGTRDGLGARALRGWVGGLRARVRRAGLATADQTFGIAWSGAMTEARVIGLLRQLPPGVSEIYFHPAVETGAPLTPAMAGYRHAEELAALISPRVRETLATLGLERTKYGALTAS